MCVFLLGDIVMSYSISLPYMCDFINKETNTVPDRTVNTLNGKVTRRALILASVFFSIYWIYVHWDPDLLSLPHKSNYICLSKDIDIYALCVLVLKIQMPSSYLHSLPYIAKVMKVNDNDIFCCISTYITRIKYGGLFWK